MINNRPSAATEAVHSPFIATIPRVNLLPASVSESIAAGRIRRRFALGFLVILIAGVAVWLLQNGNILDAEARLASAQRDNVMLGAEVHDLAPVGQLYEQITSQEGFIREALASEVVASSILTDLESVGGTAIDFTNIAMTFTGVPDPAQASDPAASLNLCPDADPFGTDITIGCVSFTAQGKSRSDVSGFLERMAADPAFIGTYVTTTTITGTADGGPQLSFTGSTGISVQGLKTVLTQQQIDELLEAAVPTPSAPGTSEGNGTP